MSECKHLQGFIHTKGYLIGTVSGMVNITGNVHSVGSAYKEYKGDYVVEPKLKEEQVLPTKDMVMLDDVTVLKVPVYKTKNATGGYTIYVAERIDE